MDRALSVAEESVLSVPLFSNLVIFFSGIVLQQQLLAAVVQMRTPDADSAASSASGGAPPDRSGGALLDQMMRGMMSAHLPPSACTRRPIDSRVTIGLWGGAVISMQLAREAGGSCVW